MSGDREPPILRMILFPFRLIGLLADLSVQLWLLMLCGGLALLGAFVWWLLTGVPS